MNMSPIYFDTYLKEGMNTLETYVWETRNLLVHMHCLKHLTSIAAFLSLQGLGKLNPNRCFPNFKLYQNLKV